MALYVHDANDSAVNAGDQATEALADALCKSYSLNTRQAPTVQPDTELNSYNSSHFCMLHLEVDSWRGPNV